jgi:hypothetical protein
MRRCTVLHQDLRNMVQPDRHLRNRCSMRPIFRLQKCRDSKTPRSTSSTVAQTCCGRHRPSRRRNRRMTKYHGTLSAPVLRRKHSHLNTEFRRLNTTSQVTLCPRVRPRRISRRRICPRNIRPLHTLQSVLQPLNLTAVR